MTKSSIELTTARREEIIDACSQLYRVKAFRDITIKDIGAVTTFTRTSIYNYFQTKEEIFLAMHQREYELWCEELRHILDDHETMDRECFADALANSLEHRSLLLKLMSMNHFDMEENTRPEMLVDFKRSYGQSMAIVGKCLEKFFKTMTSEEREGFLYIFFPFMFGIYPYTEVTEKQKSAMDCAGVEFNYQSIYGISKRCIQVLLSKV